MADQTGQSDRPVGPGRPISHNKSGLGQLREGPCRANSTGWAKILYVRLHTRCVLGQL